MVSDLVTRMEVFEESHADASTASAQAVAARDERIKKIEDLRTDVSSLTETQSGMAPEMDLQFARTSECLSRLEEAKEEQQIQRLLSGNRPAGKSAIKKPSSKKSKKSKRSRKDDESSDTDRSDISSNKDSESEVKVASDRSSDDEEDGDSGKDLRSKLLRHNSHHQSPMGVRFRKRVASTPISSSFVQPTPCTTNFCPTVRTASR